MDLRVEGGFESWLLSLTRWPLAMNATKPHNVCLAKVPVLLAGFEIIDVKQIDVKLGLGKVFFFF